MRQLRRDRQLRTAIQARACFVQPRAHANANEFGRVSASEICGHARLAIAVASSGVWGSVLKVSLCAIIATILLPSGRGYADDGATVDDAHSYLEDIFNTGAIWYRGHRITEYSSIGECNSELNYTSRDDGDGALKFDWSHVTSFNVSGSYTYFWGAIAVEVGDKEGVAQGVVLNSPDAITAKRIANASKLLINACSSRSKFDD